MPTTSKTLLCLAAFILFAAFVAAGARAEERIRGLDSLNNKPPETTGSAVREQPTPQAPVGHRQPRASDMPGTAEPDAFDVRIKELNPRMGLEPRLRICRDC